jgi:hypothetical protein
MIKFKEFLNEASKKRKTNNKSADLIDDANKYLKALTDKFPSMDDWEEIEYHQDQIWDVALKFAKRAGIRYDDDFDELANEGVEMFSYIYERITPEDETKFLSKLEKAVSKFKEVLSTKSIKVQKYFEGVKK